jgi:hypothetical protein
MEGRHELVGGIEGDFSKARKLGTRDFSVYAEFGGEDVKP